jgi:hypothetical protein
MPASWSEPRDCFLSRGVSLGLTTAALGSGGTTLPVTPPEGGGTTLTGEIGGGGFLMRTGAFGPTSPGALAGGGTVWTASVITTSWDSSSGVEALPDAPRDPLPLDGSASCGPRRALEGGGRLPAPKEGGRARADVAALRQGKTRSSSSSSGGGESRGDGGDGLAGAGPAPPSAALARPRWPAGWPATKEGAGIMYLGLMGSILPT